MKCLAQGHNDMLTAVGFSPDPNTNALVHCATASLVLALKIYTDGSKNKEECVGVGIYIPDFKISISKRASDQLSVYTAEMLAVIIGLQWVEEVRPDRVVMCTDSLSILQSIQSTTTAREDILIELNHSLLRLHRGSIDLQFCWVPAHGGVKGNQCADKLVHYKRKSHYQFNLEKEKEKQ